MIQTYNQQYVIKQDEGVYRYHYSDGTIESVYLQNLSSEFPKVTVTFRNGNIFSWKKAKSYVYYAPQFGISVSYDGRFVFFQTWECGLFAIDAKTGDEIWKTKSRRGITDIYVNKDTLVCCQHEKALQLLNINTGEVIKEMKTTDWGFNSIDKAHIICHIKANQWCLIDAEKLEVLETFSHRMFTDGHTDYVVQSINAEDGKLHIRGFKNVYDDSTKPFTILPNLTFENIIETKTKLLV